jgi:hypothetical protein
MSIDKAIRALHITIYNDFGALEISQQQAVLKTLNELIAILKLSMQ